MTPEDERLLDQLSRRIFWLAETATGNDLECRLAARLRALLAEREANREALIEMCQEVAGEVLLMVAEDPSLVSPDAAPKMVCDGAEEIIERIVTEYLAQHPAAGREEAK